MQPFFWHWQPLPFPPLPFTQGCPCANWGAARLEKCTSIPHNLAHPPHGQATKCAGKTVQKKDKCNWCNQRNTFQHQFSWKCNIYTSTHAYTHIPIYLISKLSASPGSHCLVQVSRFFFRQDYQIAKLLGFKIWGLRQGLRELGEQMEKCGTINVKEATLPTFANICKSVKHLQPMRIFRDGSRFWPGANCTTLQRGVHIVDNITMWKILLNCSTYIHTHTTLSNWRIYNSGKDEWKKGRNFLLLTVVHEDPPKLLSAKQHICQQFQSSKENIIFINYHKGWILNILYRQMNLT